jgi:uncharacterized protein YjbJ (UPF0337 family)
LLAFRKISSPIFRRRFSGIQQKILISPAPYSGAVLTVLPVESGVDSLVLRNSFEEEIMNWDQMAGKWKQLKGSAKSRWGKLTDDDLDVIAGQRDQLIGRVQERYGIAKEEAQRQVDDWGRTQRDENEYQKQRDLDRKAS